MKGYIEHLIASDNEVMSEIEMDSLNESFDIEDDIESMEFDDEFSNEEIPGELGGNVDGETNLNIPDTFLDGDDMYLEHSSKPDEDDLYGFQDLDESAKINLRKYKGF